MLDQNCGISSDNAPKLDEFPTGSQFILDEQSEQFNNSLTPSLERVG